ncbi:MAG TPA: Na+/H+ antiporter NhaC [Candidatus Hydrogenedens sp.]|nr:Na+/H+ antiporter NhaC [Candidatus Hydrogenedens sp.]HOK09321.1 Na+/H+ antiporter NhaC [Candidatus Hydrogenedens sp.]HOL19818.1 Na+/H+ antiporter NhaC [Candidatus Hydrogenedens sp.]HPP58609.1 Na+/H+ antiporter NhaC [Candidatus Hydrogenedens sp.]
MKENAVTLKLALLPCILLIVLLVINVWLFGDEATSGPCQVALLISSIIGGIIGHTKLGLSYRDIEKKAIHSIVLAMEAIIILLIVGATIALWIQGGIVPTVIYYGVKILTTKSFPIVACIICSIVSLAIGSSWSTMGTIGVALMGIGKALGYSEPLIAGAIISGAYLGDKMSPLSDTTNLAPAVSGTNLFVHVKNMLNTTVPSYIITLIVFLVIGLLYNAGNQDIHQTDAIIKGLEQNFTIHWAFFAVPITVIFLAMRKTPAIPALTIGCILGGILSFIFQNGTPKELSQLPIFVSQNYQRIIHVAYHGYVLQSGIPVLDDLLSTGGMEKMFSTISLIIMAMLFGGVMEATGMLQKIAETMLHYVHSAGQLMASTVVTCVIFNVFAAEQYLAIIIPGRMFRASYVARDLDMRNLSRVLEDGATVTSVLVPWNTCGAFASSVLGVSTFHYLPFCFFNWITPLISIFMSLINYNIIPAKPQEKEDINAQSTNQQS